MRQIFLGMLFVFLDFNLNLGNVTLGLIPDFVGYILLIRGLDALAAESRRFVQARPWAVVAAAYSGALYGLDLLGIGSSLGIFAWALGLASLALSAYLSGLVVRGILEMERTKGCGLAGSALQGCWMAAVITSALCYPLAFVPVLGWSCVLAGLICNILFLAALW